MRAPGDQYRGPSDRVVLGLAAAGLLAWDLAGGDALVAGWFGSSAGFPLRDHWLLARVLHDGGRWLSAAVLALAVWDASRSPGRGPDARQRLRWLFAVLACLVLVPALKRLSPTSCPYELQAFGGTSQWLSHWQFWRPDGGQGHCFPSGHAVAGFAFLPIARGWRQHDRLRSAAWLTTALVLGTAFGAAQVARGAHFASHVGWSAWLCAVLAQFAAARPPAPHRTAGPRVWLAPPASGG
ncbi:MAG: phosphatase PAP2 family protein [Aquabacterium sp.]